jgi:hypothetical protein
VYGRDAASSDAQWNALPSAVTPFLGSALEAWDPDAAAGSGATAPLPTTARNAVVRGLTYRTSWYIGRCWQPATGGLCDQTAAAGDVPMFRAVVAVTWTDAGCPNSTCTYADAALVSNTADPIFS